jgi:hypothetical protein
MAYPVPWQRLKQHVAWVCRKPKLQQASCHERPAHEMVNNVECFIIVSLSRLQEKPISPAMIDLSID